MRLYLHLTGLLVAAPLLLAAEPPLGTVAARGPVTLSGVELPMAGIPAWPIASGDVLATSGFPAWILLNDRSRIAVDSNSRVSIEDTGDVVKVTLLDLDTLTIACAPGINLAGYADKYITVFVGNKLSFNVIEAQKYDDSLFLVLKTTI